MVTITETPLYWEISDNRDNFKITVVINCDQATAARQHLCERCGWCNADTVIVLDNPAATAFKAALLPPPGYAPLTDGPFIPTPSLEQATAVWHSAVAVFESLPVVCLA